MSYFPKLLPYLPVSTVSSCIHPWFQSRIPEDSCTLATTSQSSFHIPCSVCASFQRHTCESPFSPNPEPRSCTPHVQRFVRLSAIRDRFSKLSRCTCCEVQPLLSCIVEETKPAAKCPLEQLGIHSRRLPTCVKLLISPLSLPTIQRFGAHNPVKQSVTLF